MILSDRHLDQLRDADRGFRRQAVEQVAKRTPWNPTGYTCWMSHYAVADAPTGQKYPDTARFEDGGLLVDPEALSEIDAFLRGSLDAYHLLNLRDTGLEFELRRVSVGLPREHRDRTIQLYRDARGSLGETPALAERWSSFVRLLVPLNVTFPAGISSHHCRGAILLSPHSVHNLKESMAHELGHQTLMVVQGADPVLDLTDINRPVWSMARYGDRPAIQVVHACAAAAFMLRANRTDDAKDAARSRQLVLGLRRSLTALLQQVTPTEVGRLVLLDIAAEMAAAESIYGAP